MKYPTYKKYHDIGKFCSSLSKTGVQSVFGCIFYDHEDECFVATDKKILIKVPTGSQEGDELPQSFLKDEKPLDKSFKFSVKDFQNAIKALVNEKQTLPVLAQGFIGSPQENVVNFSSTDLNTESRIRAEEFEPERPYPDYKQVFPTGEPLFIINISATRLKTIIDYFAKHNTDKINHRIILSLYKNEETGTIKIQGRVDDDLPLAEALLSPMI